MRASFLFVLIGSAIWRAACFFYCRKMMEVPLFL